MIEKSNGTREMTLDEFIETLPVTHQARAEYIRLRYCAALSLDAVEDIRQRAVRSRHLMDVFNRQTEADRRGGALPEQGAPDRFDDLAAAARRVVAAGNGLRDPLRPPAAEAKQNQQSIGGGPTGEGIYKGGSC